MFQKPSKIGTTTRKNVKFGNNVHNYLKNQEIRGPQFNVKYIEYVCHKNFLKIATYKLLL